MPYKVIVIKTTVLTPSVPNFLKQEGGGTLPIAAVSDEGLRLVGEAFTQELIKKAREARKNESDKK